MIALINNLVSRHDREPGGRERMRRLIDMVRRGHSFVRHLETRHQVTRLMLISGDGDVEVQYLAGLVGIQNLRCFQQTLESELRSRLGSVHRCSHHIKV